MTTYICVSMMVPDRDTLISAIRSDVVQLDRLNLKKICDSVERYEETQDITIGLVWRSRIDDHKVPFLRNETYGLTENVRGSGYIHPNIIEGLKMIHTDKNVNVTLDLLSCNLNAEDFVAEVKALEAEHSWLNIRYSTNNTGNQTDWIMESDNTNVRDIYFNHRIENYRYLLDNEYLVTETDLIPEISYSESTKTFRLNSDLYLTDYTNDDWDNRYQ